MAYSNNYSRCYSNNSLLHEVDTVKETIVSRRNCAISMQSPRRMRHANPYQFPITKT